MTLKCGNGTTLFFMVDYKKVDRRAAMLDKDKIQRINTLAAKKKSGSITGDERSELKGLR